MPPAKAPRSVETMNAAQRALHEARDLEKLLLLAADDPSSLSAQSHVLQALEGITWWVKQAEAHARDQERQRQETASGVTRWKEPV